MRRKIPSRAARLAFEAAAHGAVVIDIAAHPSAHQPRLEIAP